jgi:hypothetical protein
LPEDAHPPTGIGIIIATPALAGLLWFPVYLYADQFKTWTSDGWGMAPLGTFFMVVCGTVLALQLVLLLRALPDTMVGRWAEAILATCFSVAVAVVIFGYLGISTAGEGVDGFPDRADCIVGLLVGGLLTVAIPTVTIARRAKNYPPQGEPLRGSARLRLILVAAATILVVAVPTAANATESPQLLWGLVLIPVIDLVGSLIGRRSG